jgi:transglutaminase-like putative cysteine protease
MTTTDALEQFLLPTEYVDSDAPGVAAFAHRVAGAEPDPAARAVRLYYAVRDEIVYTPYCDFSSVETFRASACLARSSGFCVGKAALLAAAARAAGIPARVGFADVRNHLTTAKLRALMGTDLFVYHGYAELFLGGRWVKATPAFDRGLCARFGVRPLEFDATTDALLHPSDVSGRRHMEYVNDRGAFADVPVADIMAAFRMHYPGLAVPGEAPSATRFRHEAEQSRRAGNDLS